MDEETMNAEQLFWEINEIIRQKMYAMSESEREALVDSLVEDTDDVVLSFDLATIAESF
jgi:hypothetical protein